jgi:hypothetical protein
MAKRKLAWATKDDDESAADHDAASGTTAGSSRRRSGSRGTTSSVAAVKDDTIKAPAASSTSVATTTRKKTKPNKSDNNKDVKDEADQPSTVLTDANTTTEESGDVVVVVVPPVTVPAAGNTDRNGTDDGDIKRGASVDQRSSSPGVPIPDDDDGNCHRSKYDVRQMVLARDDDGLLYFARIRRKMYGINHQTSISVLGIFDLSVEEVRRSRNGESSKIVDGDRDDGERQSSNSSAATGNGNTPSWFYFVHFEGWKVNWDRWVVESDIMDATPKNVERMQVVAKTHRALQHEVKEKSKHRKIRDAGLFLKMWKHRLDGLYVEWDKLDNPSAPMLTKLPSGNNKDKGYTRKKKDTSPKKRGANTKSAEEEMKGLAKLAIKSCLTTRDPAHVQAIPLAFGLKRILVEDWEILNAASRGDADDTGKNIGTGHSCGMVHCLPAKVTIRDALSAYLKEKGVVWDGISPDRRQRTITSNKSKDVESDSPITKGEKHNDSKPGPSLLGRDSPEAIRSSRELAGSSDDTSIADKEMSTTETSSMAVAIEVSISGNHVKNLKYETDNIGDGSVEDHSTKSQSGIVQPVNENTSPCKTSTGAETGEKLALTKQWTDMADGIVIYFEQALLTRLLYPSEVAQYAVLEEDLSNDTPLCKVEIYGCEHLLRLLAVMPRILDQQLKDSKSKRTKIQNVEASTSVPTDTRKSTAPQERDGDNDFAEKGSMILAKLQDLARFLQKNQSSLFCSMYRKRSEAEVKQDVRIQKRLERRLKKKTDQIGYTQEGQQ